MARRRQKFRTKKVFLTNSDLYAFVDEEDWFLWGLWRHKWRVKWSSTVSSVYIATDIKRNGDLRNKTVYLHRMIMGEPEGMEVDHGDHDPFNNRSGNLEVVTKQENLVRRAYSDKRKLVVDDTPI